MQTLTPNSSQPEVQTHLLSSTGGAGVAVTTCPAVTMAAGGFTGLLRVFDAGYPGAPAGYGLAYTAVLAYGTDEVLEVLI